MVHAWKHQAVWYETHTLYMEDRWDGARLLPEILKKETVKDQIRSPLECSGFGLHPKGNEDQEII